MHSPRVALVSPNKNDVYRKRVLSLEKECSKVKKETDRIFFNLCQSRKLLKKFKSEKRLIVNYLENKNDAYHDQVLPADYEESKVFEFVAGQLKAAGSALEQHLKKPAARSGKAKGSGRGSTSKDPLSTPPGHNSLSRQASFTTPQSVVNQSSPSTSIQNVLETKPTPVTPSGKKARQKRDPDAPKKPVNVYFIFCDKLRPKVQAEYIAEHGPDKEIDKREINTRLSQMWAKLDDSQKQEYHACYNIEKAKFDKNLAIYQANKSKESASTGPSTPQTPSLDTSSSSIKLEKTVSPKVTPVAPISSSPAPPPTPTNRKPATPAPTTPTPSTPTQTSIPQQPQQPIGQPALARMPPNTSMHPQPQAPHTMAYGQPGMSAGQPNPVMTTQQQMYPQQRMMMHPNFQQQQHHGYQMQPPPHQMQPHPGYIAPQQHMLTPQQQFYQQQQQFMQQQQQMAAQQHHMRPPMPPVPSTVGGAPPQYRMMTSNSMPQSDMLPPPSTAMDRGGIPSPTPMLHQRSFSGPPGAAMQQPHHPSQLQPQQHPQQPLPPASMLQPQHSVPPDMTYGAPHSNHSSQPPSVSTAI